MKTITFKKRKRGDTQISYIIKGAAVLHILIHHVINIVKNALSHTLD